MHDIETYYLVDFENVNEEGLSCSSKLKSNNHIHIFSTINAPKISFDTLTSFNSIELCSHIVPAKKQSLDMHLVSYLGYLIGKNNTVKCKYVIVSKDTDYDNIISFFKEISFSDITRQTSIEQSPKQNPTQSSVAVKNNAENKKANKPQAASQEKNRLNNIIQQAVSNAGYSNATSNITASIVVKHYCKDNPLSNIHNELRGACPEYSDIYKIIKPIIKEYYSVFNNEEASACRNSNDIQKTLENAAFNSSIINYVSTLCSKFHNEKNVKQAVYREIVAKYGQKQGLNIYNHIKKSL